MKEENKEVRTAIDDAGLRHWQVAGQVGVHPSTLTVWLRTPLTKEREDKVKQAIQDLTPDTADV